MIEYLATALIAGGAACAVLVVLARNFFNAVDSLADEEMQQFHDYGQRRDG